MSTIDTTADASSPSAAPTGRGLSAQGLSVQGPSTQGPSAQGLSAQGLRVDLAGHTIVDGVDITVPRGAFAAVLGPNGAGKSTLLHAIAAGIPARADALLFGQTDLLHARRRIRARTVALVEQEPAAPESLAVTDVVALGRIPYEGAWGRDSADSRRVVERALADAHADELAERSYITLSGGEKQRVNLARALAQEPELLLLDEPTNHLDVHAQLQMLSLLRTLTRSGVTVLAALHDLSLAAGRCDHVIILADGQVVAAGPPESVLTPDLILAVWHVRADILTHPATGRPVIVMAEADAAAPAAAQAPVHAPTQAPVR